MKIATTLIILIGLAVMAASTQSGRALQATQRSATYTKMCASYPDRTQLVDDKAKADATTNKAAMKGSFKLSGNQLIGGIMKHPDGILAGVVAQGPNLYTDFGIYVAPFVIGLIVIILIWPFLCCCCCCPGCCPSKCCQKPENEQYTKCELVWPAIVLILAFLLLLVASVIGITRANDIEISYKTVGCSAAITFDDILNGNTATTGNYFIGFNGLVRALANLKSNMNGVKTQLDLIKFSNTGGDLRLAYNEGTNLLNTLSRVPDSNIGGNLAPYTYNHFDGSAGTISSTFPSILGSANTGSPSGAMNGTFYAINLINQGLKTIGDNAGNFSDQFSSVSGAIDQLSDSMGGLSNVVSGFDTSFSGVDDSLSPVMKIVTIAVTAFFGVFIGFAVLGIIGTLLITFCEKFSCRYLLYFICVILFLLGFISFFLSLIFSAFTPVLYLGCDFLTVSIQSSAGFTANLGNAIGGQFSSYLSVCLPGSSGDIINQLQGVDLSTINGLSNAVSSMNTFSASVLQTGVNTALTTLSTLIDQYYYTDVFDFNSASDKTYMSNIASKTGYACTDPDFATDSWVPSLRQTDIPCSGTSSQATSTNCPTSASISGRTGTCKGCMDSMKILQAAAITPGTDIPARYPSAGACTSWTGAMVNVWNRYYNIKKTNIGPVKTRMATTLTTYNTASSGYHDRLTTLGNRFTTISSTLSSTVSSVVDPQYGMIAGLNCLLLGQDINLVANTACTKLFNTFYFLRLTLGIAAFGILFSLCCTTCTGVRAFKHSTRRGSVLPKQLGGDQQESTMAALNNPR